jgi:hypothetical protein
MNKYNIEDNLNFYEELLKDDDDDDDNDNDDDKDNHKKKENGCLLTGLPLVKNSIKLECNHIFNYDALFNEVSKQKIYNELDTQYLSFHQIRCPYCRTITNQLLPYIPSINKKKVNGVNSPDKFTMKHKVCSYVFLCGKNKGKKCYGKGFETDFDCDLCEKHWKMKVAKVAKEKIPKVAKEKIPKVAKEKAPKVAKEKAPKIAKEKAPKVAKEKAPKVAKSASTENNTEL